jgi:hypothetical protein
MKRLSLALLGALMLTVFGPIPIVSAHSWWWHHHSDPAPMGVGANDKTKKSKNHPEKRPKQVKNPPLYAQPKSVGWWFQKSPGPMGAGSGNESNSKTKTAHNQKQKDTQTQASHKSFFNWFHHTANNNSNPQPTGSGQ